METITVLYRFLLPENVEQTFSLKLDAESIELVDDILTPPPVWTKLEFHRCPNCLLNAKEQRHCPLVLHLVPVVERFAGILSYEMIHLEVVTEERFISQQTSAQRGVSSLLGLIMATSGCPHTAFFKPMARFHLPLASEEETVYRAISTYMLAQFFRRNAGEKADFALKGLCDVYENIHQVNIAIATRLRAGAETDSVINAVVMLDMFTKYMPFIIKDSLEEIRYLFEPYMAESRKRDAG